MDETLDPQSNKRGRSGDDSPASPALVVLFHPDLRRVGDVHRLALEAQDSIATLTLGRDEPAFRARDGRWGALHDPCISRQQLTVRYLPSPPRFAVVCAPKARRGLSVLTILGQRVDEHTVPPGSLLALGDRVLLWVGLLPPRQPVEDFGIVGVSAEATRTRREIRALATETTTVLIRGETGTGKELVARALHAGGPRAGEPFLAVNCAAIPDALLDSELFGHARGAFSGATQARHGLFRAAGGGTIFLDEIGELSPSAQAKLLRTLQEGTVRPVGEAREQRFAARVVAATHRPLEHEVAAGRFRSDLLARIETPRIDLAPLRDRRIDVPILFAHFLGRAARASGSEALIFREASAEAPPLPMSIVLALLAQPWSKNIRELEKLATVAELAYRTDGRWPSGLTEAPHVLEGPPRSAVSPLPAPRAAAPNAETISRLLDRHDFVARRVAEELGVSRTTLDKWMRELGIRRPSDIGSEEIEAACARFDGDLPRTAAALRVSVRGLRLRLRELGLAPG